MSSHNKITLVSVKTLKSVHAPHSGRRIRLHGIDAPERQQNCFVEGSSWNCGEWTTDYLKALLNTFCTANGYDLNGWLVRVGVATAFGRYGIWAGECVEPWKWRSRQVAKTVLNTFFVCQTCSKI